MKFKKEELIALFTEEYSDEFEVIDEGNWISDGKREFAAYIFKYAGKYYRVYFARSGSYYTDWYYDYEDWPDEVEVPEVVPVEQVVIKWEIVN